jgi:hypothetical protein
MKVGSFCQEKISTKSELRALVQLGRLLVSVFRFSVGGKKLLPIFGNFPLFSHLCRRRFGKLFIFIQLMNIACNIF